jgi:hypothetical protein
MTKRLPYAALLTGLGLAALACTGELPPQVIPDAPVRATSAPAPGLSLTAALDHSALSPGGTVRFTVELRNAGTAPVPLPAAGPCPPALQAMLLDAAGQPAWSEPQPMCAMLMPPVPITLPPGQSVTDGRCFALGGQVAGCTTIWLAGGTYTVAGHFQGYVLPQLQMRIAPHRSTTLPGTQPGGQVTAAPGAVRAFPPATDPSGRPLRVPAQRTEPPQTPD